MYTYVLGYIILYVHYATVYLRGRCARSAVRRRATRAAAATGAPRRGAAPLEGTKGAPKEWGS